MNLAFLQRQLKVVTEEGGTLTKCDEEYFPESRSLFSGNATSNFKNTRDQKLWPAWYRAWHTMCHSAFTKKESEVCLAWRDSATFKLWYDKHYVEGRAMCARFGYPGERLYCPYTTAFVDQEVIKWLMPKGFEGRMRGVIVRNLLNVTTYYAVITRYGKRVSIGRFKSEKEAHRAWILEKIKLGKELAAHYADNVIVTRGMGRAIAYLQDCYDNDIEVTKV